MTGAVSSRAGARRLRGIVRPLGLATKGALVYAPLFRTGKRQPHVLEFEHGLRAHATHVLDRVLVTDVIGTLDRVIHVPTPVVVRVGAGYSAGNATLRRHRVRARGEHLGNHRGLVAGLRQLQCGPHAGSAAANNHTIKRNRSQCCHNSISPEDLHAPDHIHKKHQRYRQL